MDGHQSTTVAHVCNIESNTVHNLSKNTEKAKSDPTRSSSSMVHAYEEFPRKRNQRYESYEETNADCSENICRNDLNDAGVGSKSSRLRSITGDRSLEEAKYFTTACKNDSIYNLPQLVASYDVIAPSSSSLNSQEIVGVRCVLPESLSRESLKRSFGSSISTLGEIPAEMEDSLLVTTTLKTTLQEGVKDSTPFIGSTPSTPSRDTSTPYGWFNTETVDEKMKQSQDLRDAYIARTQSHLEYSNSGNSSSESSNSHYNDQNDPSLCWAAASLDNEVQQISYDEIPDHSILFKWRNPNPSMTLKHSGSSLEKNLEPAVGSFELRVSCFIGGYRTVQLQCGNIRAEFQFIFSYGSKSFSCWKPFTEFRKLHRIISHVHKSNQSFPKTMEEWSGLRCRQKWYRCLSVVYLIEKSVLLGRYMQAMLMECDSPGLMLYFVQSKAIAQ